MKILALNRSANQRGGRALVVALEGWVTEKAISILEVFFLKLKADRDKDWMQVPLRGTLAHARRRMTP